MPKPFEIALSGHVEAELITQGAALEADTTALRALAFYLDTPLPDSPRAVIIAENEQIPNKKQPRQELLSFGDYIPPVDTKNDFVIRLPEGNIKEHYFTVQIANELVRRKTHRRHGQLVAGGCGLLVAEIAGGAYATVEHHASLSNAAIVGLGLTAIGFFLSIRKIDRYTMPDLTEIDSPISIVSIHEGEDDEDDD